MRLTLLQLLNSCTFFLFPFLSEYCVCDPEFGNKEVFENEVELSEDQDDVHDGDIVDLEAPVSEQENVEIDSMGGLLPDEEGSSDNDMIVDTNDEDDEQATVTDVDWDEGEPKVKQQSTGNVSIRFTYGSINALQTIAGEDGITGVQMSLLPDANATAHNLSDSSIANLTDKVTKKIMCVGKNLTANDTLPLEDVKVQEVNSTELLQRLAQKNDTSGNCAIVLFYAPWCMFCARTAPHYNALARAFPQMDVMAIDAIHFSK